jgi:hypothetical protein
MAQRRQLLPASDAVGVLFAFPDSAEVRYLSRPPAPGTRVRSSNGHVWIVSNVVRTGENTLTVHCVAQQDPNSARTTVLRRGPALRDPRTERHALAEPGTKKPGAFERLGTHLVTLARRAIQTPTRPRRKMRHYVP